MTTTKDHLLHEGKTETLNEDIYKLGYMNFNVTHKEDRDYINRIYSEDFERFGYDKL